MYYEHDGSMKGQGVGFQLMHTAVGLLSAAHV